MRAFLGALALSLAMQGLSIDQYATIPVGGRLLQTVEGRGVQIYRCDKNGWVVPGA